MATVNIANSGWQTNRETSTIGISTSSTSVKFDMGVRLTDEMAYAKACVAIDASKYKTIDFTYSKKIAGGISSLEFGVYDNMTSNNSSGKIGIATDAWNTSGGSVTIDVSTLTGIKYVGFRFYGNTYTLNEDVGWQVVQGVTITSLTATERGYTLTYNANGGSGAPSSVSNITSTTISSTVPTRSGYDFLGWSTSQSTTSTNRVPTSTDTNGSIYNGCGYKDNARLSSSGGVSGEPQDGSVTTGFIPFTLTNVIRMKGAAWLGNTSTYGGHWYLNFYGSGKTLLGSCAVSEQTYSGGTWDGHLSVDYNVATDVTTFKLTDVSQATGLTGRLKDGDVRYFRINAYGKGADLIITVHDVEYVAGNSISLQSNTTLYAVWEKKTYAVTYNANGGSGAPSTQYKTHGTALTLSTTRPTKADTSAGSYMITLNANGGTCSVESLTAKRTTSYSFRKWNTNSSGTGTNYDAGASYNIDAALPLYAIYTSATRTETIALPTPTRGGFEFMGWSTNDMADSGTIGNYEPRENVTLYAIWKPLGNVYIYDGAGGFNPYQVLIYDGSDWNQYVPYIYTYSGWEMYSG